MLLGAAAELDQVFVVLELETIMNTNVQVDLRTQDGPLAAAKVRVRVL